MGMMRAVAQAAGRALVVAAGKPLVVAFFLILPTLPSDLGHWHWPLLALACAAAIFLAWALRSDGEDHGDDAEEVDHARLPLGYLITGEEATEAARLMASWRNLHRWRMAVRINDHERTVSPRERTDSAAAAAEANGMPASSWSRAKPLE